MSLEIGCVLVSHNSSRTVIDSLKSAISIVDEIIIIDDCSTDGTAQLIYDFVDQFPELRERIRLIEKDKNTGQSHSRNMGLQISKNDFVLLMDADIVLSGVWLEHAIRELRGSVAIVGGRTKVPVRNLISWYMSTLREYDNQKKRISYIGGGVALYNRRIILSVDGFNESMRSAEEIDLARRLRERGYEIKRLHESNIHLGEPQTLKSLLMRQWRYRKYPPRNLLSAALALIFLTPVGLVTWVPLIPIIFRNRPSRFVYLLALPIINHLFLGTSYVCRFLPR